jgi:hypothetical protein
MGGIPLGGRGDNGLDPDCVGMAVVMSTRFLIWALVIVAIIFIANLGGLWLVSTLW